MTWLGKSLAVINTISSLCLLGAITWMILESRKFRDDFQRLEDQVKAQKGRWDDARTILAAELKEKADGNRQFVWEVRGDGKTIIPQETITVREARRRVQELEHGGPGKPSLADLGKKLDALHLEGAKLRDDLDTAQQETRRLGDDLAKVSAQARAILPAPDRPSPVEEMYMKRQEAEAEIKRLEFPLNSVRRDVALLTSRQAQLAQRERELLDLGRVPPFKPPPGPQQPPR
ncbi:MAG: hypothetical protein RMJ19_11050 [Gemmatales bacterium]|nr:hypothetical protein [Gemmatales bacterium]MCS7160997.1 hypothetical protein [Gemmatales bacterium]MDW8176200.1 hypothetical protein [Gemmatales bacterium]MDW8223743.1 hypothetical protein [Gemmatales bacterium]